MFSLVMKLSDWSMDQYKLTITIFSILFIIIMLVYTAISSKNNN